MDFTLADFHMPVVRKTVGDVLERLALGDIQRIPVTVNAWGDGYEILNVTSVVDCLVRNARG